MKTRFVVRQVPWDNVVATAATRAEAEKARKMFRRTKVEEQTWSEQRQTWVDA